MFGLIESDIRYIHAAMSQFDEIDYGIIFGSRASGNYKKGSDVDLVIKGDGITSETINRLSDLLNEEYPLPYFFDVIHYESIFNLHLKTHIDDDGKIIFEAEK